MIEKLLNDYLPATLTFIVGMLSILKDFEWKFRKKNQKTENGDIWRPEKFTCRVFLRGYLNDYPMKYVISTFPCIDMLNMKILLKKAIWAKAQMKGVPKGAPFLFVWKGGPGHGRRNIF